MSFERYGGGGLDYAPCTHGASNLAFRGPRRDLAGDYLAFLGSTRTFGKFVRAPFAELVGRSLGLEAVNLGCVNAGLDTFVGETAVHEICSGARACVVQVMGAHKLSNPFYTVHRRRNDRVLAPTARLTALYPEIDFTEIHFARHLVATLAARGDPRFSTVRHVLKRTWSARMRRLVAAIEAPVVLLWLADRTEDTDDAGPLFVDQGMLDDLAPFVSDVVTVDPDPAGALRGTEGMLFSPLEEPVARNLPGPETHRRIAAEIADCLTAILSPAASGVPATAARALRFE